MRALSKNFTDSEFHCKCGDCTKDEVAMDSGLIQKLQRIRTSLGVPLIITSGVRCDKHNRTIKGAVLNSWHVPRDGICYAADFTYRERDLRTPLGMTRLYIAADQGGALGIGLYDNRIHMDTRTEGGRARWTDKTFLWRE
jgi:uncharacterized protein YcbK (DUF882 family)